jgi:hypothetical protein
MKYQILLMKAINPKRKKFCRLVAGGESGAGAYRKAYKNKNSTTCKTNAHRLMQQPGVLIYLAVIHCAKQQAGPPPTNNATAPKRAAAKKPKATSPKAKPQSWRQTYGLYEMMDATERRIMLSRIARGQTFISKYIVIKHRLFELPVPPNSTQRLGCIKELNKMRGIYP